jgi:hypothetical protein
MLEEGQRMPRENVGPLRFLRPLSAFNDKFFRFFQICVVSGRITSQEISLPAAGW